MNDEIFTNLPRAIPLVQQETLALGFKMGSEPQTGSLLATLAASKRRGSFLELGTGTGIGTAWLLEGMDPASTLDTVEEDEAVLQTARKHLGHDHRVTFHLEEGAQFLKRNQNKRYDFIFADTWPGKFHHLDEALRLLKPGGFYVVDDLLPQPSWPEDHAPKVPKLIQELETRADLLLTKLGWATGLIIATKV